MVTIMKYLFPIVLLGCGSLECEYPYTELPENIEFVSCVPVEEGCSPDAQYCKGKWTHPSESNPEFMITSYVYWVRHLNENIQCAGYEDCTEAYNYINDWCGQNLECWRADRVPAEEVCDAVDC